MLEPGLGHIRSGARTKSEPPAVLVLAQCLEAASIIRTWTRRVNTNLHVHHVLRQNSSVSLDAAAKALPGRLP